MANISAYINRIFKKGKRKNVFGKKVTVGDYSLFANHDHLIENYLKEHKFYSKNLPRIAKLIEGKYSKYSIIDIGANIGDTIALLRSEGVKQMIYCFEGEPVYFELLEKNAKIFNQVKIYKQFLGEETITAKLQISSTAGTAKLDNTSEQEIDLKKLDDIFDLQKLENLKLLKVDTDGYDIKILKGSQKIIEKFKPVIFFEYDAVFIEEQGDDWLGIFQTFNAIGYQTIIFYDNYGNLLLSTSIDNIFLITQLHNYIKNKESKIQYYDICLFHKSDEAIAQEIIIAETALFINHSKIKRE